MLSVLREDPRQPAVSELLDLSDAYSASLYPKESRHPVDMPFLAGPSVRFFVARDDGVALGCGAMIIGTDCTAELKRLIVRPDARGRGIGRALLTAIETAALDEQVRVLLLETGPESREALTLYHRCGYRLRPPFGSYQAGPHSVFLEKTVMP
jgi:putative acetyltransferase